MLEAGSLVTAPGWNRDRAEEGELRHRYSGENDEGSGGDLLRRYLPFVCENGKNRCPEFLIGLELQIREDGKNIQYPFQGRKSTTGAR